MSTQVFSAFWHGAALPPLHWACLKSFIDHGHELKLYCYRSVEVPRGVALEDAASIMEERELFEFENSFSAFSNIFRYKLLLRDGCWWVDTDMYCLTDDFPDCAYAWAKQDPVSINGAVLKFPARDPALQEILADSLKIGSSITAWGKLGPGMLTRHLNDKAFPGLIGSTQAFYPIHWLEAFRFWLPDAAAAVRRRSEDAWLLHLWASMFGRFGIDLRRTPPPGSFLAQIYSDSGYPHPLPPALPVSEQEATRTAIIRYLCQDWAPAASQSALGYDLGARVLSEGWL